MNTQERLPEGWISVKLRDIVYRADTRDPSKSTVPDFLYVDIEALDNNSQTIVAPKKIQSDKAPGRARLVIHANDVIFSLTRPYLKNIAIVPHELDNQIASTAYCVMRPEKGISSYFIFYLVTQDDFINSIITYGDSPPAAHDDEFLAMEIPLAPLAEQNRIVAAIEQQFTRLDAAVAALRSAQAKSKQYRASLLKTAVEGELTKQWRADHPASETGPQLLTRILAERRARWEQEQLAKMHERGVTPQDDKWKQAYKEPQQPDVDNLPELPDGWCWTTLGEVTWSIKDGPHYSPNYVDDGIPFITGGNVRPTGIDFTNAKRISPEINAELSKRCKPEKGDILYTKGGTTGIARVNSYSIDFNVWVHVAVLKLAGPIEPFYVQHALNSEICYAQAQKFTHGVGNQDLGLTRMVNIVLPLPPLAEQAQIVAEVEAKLSEMAQLETTIEASVRRAQQERQSILREAFAGRLVPQDPQDEPASVLLERIREERRQREATEKQEKASRKGTQMEIARKRRANKARTGQQDVGVYETLVEAGEPLPPDDVFKRVGLKVDDQPESVEAFYVELDRDVTEGLIAVTRPDDDSVLLEALEPSPELLAQMQEAGETIALQDDVEQDAPTLWDM